jgi:hypothetical protein
MICDLRKNGRVYIDEQLIYQDGKFIIQFQE